MQDKKFEIHLCDALTKLANLPDNYADAYILDPPYSSGGMTSGERQGTTTQKYVQTQTKLQRPDFSGDNRDQRSWAYWCRLWLSEALRTTKPGGPICCFVDWRQLPTLTDVLQAAGWIWRGVAVWDKTGSARPCLGRFTNQAEYIVWGSKGPMARERGVGVLPGVFRHPVKQSDKFHITGKPTPLMQEIVQIVPEGALIVDPFAGSGIHTWKA